MKPGFFSSRSVSLVLKLFANGLTAQQIMVEYPDLEEEDLRQVLQYAAWLADESVQIVEFAAS